MCVMESKGITEVTLRSHPALEASVMFFILTAGSPLRFYYLLQFTALGEPETGGEKNPRLQAFFLCTTLLCPIDD